ncbi:hypothetical protein AVEN_246664-1, partial [Araneus ventricosus]
MKSRTAMGSALLTAVTKVPGSIPGQERNESFATICIEFVQ